MINREESLPKRSDKALVGLEILWSQFNEINFYIEDEDQQNFYLCILRKFFPKIRISKIFPLNGKDNVIAEAKKTRSKKKIFIVDQDFDDICRRKVIRNNLFYLDKYSIENYLLDKVGIHELIKEDKPKITDTQIETSFCFESFKTECLNIFKDISLNFLLINKFQLGLEYIKFDTNRDCDQTIFPNSLKTDIKNDFDNLVKESLRSKKPRMKYSTQIKKHLKFFNTVNSCIRNTPGKYLLNYLKHKLRSIFKLPQISMESFVYRLGKNSELLELRTLQIKIENYIK